MLNASSKVEEVIHLIEIMVDARVRYIQEKDYENHSHASEIKKRFYDPAVEKLTQVLSELIEEESGNETK